MPTGYTPIYQILKDGIDITDHFNDRCVQMRVDLTSGDGDNDMCLFTIDDRDWPVARPSVGDRLRILMGYVEVRERVTGPCSALGATLGLVRHGPSVTRIEGLPRCSLLGDAPGRAHGDVQQ